MAKFNLKTEVIFDFRNTWRALRIIWNCSKTLTFWRMVLLFIQGILPLVPIYLLKLLLDAFALPDLPDRSYFIWILVGFAGARIVSIAVSNILTYIGLLQSDIVNDHMSRIVISKALQLDLEYYDSDDYHDMFQRAMAQAGSRPLAVLSAFTSLVQNAISLIAVLVILVTLHWAITIVLVLIAMPVAVIRWYYTERVVELQEKHTQKERRSAYLRQIMTHEMYAKEVRIFSFGRRLLNQFLQLRKFLRKERRVLHMKRTTSVGLAQGVESIAIIGTLGFIVFRALRGALTVGDIAMYYQVFQRGQSNINSLLKSFVSIHENKLYLNHLFDFLDLEIKLISPPNPSPVPEKIDKISVSDLSFIYPKTTKRVLKNINLEFNRGDIVAIVGENGSGKTTLIKLICRLYDPTEGQISVNGKSIKDFEIHELRQKLSVIFQQFSKYNATVTENIHFADFNQPLDRERIKKAAIYSQAEGFIENLPQKYGTQLGRSFRAGEELSGGQWQKLALARAFYKQADVVILDEPTSHIDPIAEAEIFNNLREVVSDNILILITHRVYNLRMANTIIVMDKGKIIEIGNHEALMEKEGMYYRMFKNQATV